MMFDRLRATPRRMAAVALVASGLAGGAVLGSTMTAGAATTATTNAPAATAPAASTATAPSASGSAPSGAPDGGYHVPDMSGTVTAVGTNSVTISGTTYAVTSASDIDKNGEATLADLKVGDAVTFDTLSSASTPTIDKLHAGSESLDRPSGPPSGAAPGAAPSAGTSSGSSSAA